MKIMTFNILEGGIDDIMITSPVVTQDKIKRVINLAKQSSKVSIVVDQDQNVKDFNAAAEAAGIVLPVLIEMRMGGNRTGIEEGKPAIDLFKVIDESKNLKFNGIQAYSGKTQHVKGFDKRKSASKEILTPALATKQEIEKAGYEVPIFTVGGTGTYNIDSNIAGITDIQAGSYLFMDADYITIGSATNSIYDDFDHSLFVISPPSLDKSQT